MGEIDGAVVQWGDGDVVVDVAFRVAKKRKKYIRAFIRDKIFYTKLLRPLNKIIKPYLNVQIVLTVPSVAIFLMRLKSPM